MCFLQLVNFRLTNYLTLSSQIGYRTAITDYLDDVSEYYKEDIYFPYDPLSYPKKGVPGTQRGDLRKRDTYMFVSIGLSYTFVSQKCFTF